MADATSGAESPRRRYGTIVVIGGGCYGSYYVRQLGRAARAGALAWDHLIVVDRNADCAVARELDEGGAEWGSCTAPRVAVSEWSSHLDAWLGRATRNPDDAAADAIVPSPLMPHLLFEWLHGRARARWPDRYVRVEPLDRVPQIPWERGAPDGTHFVSFAEWMCPVNCVEPSLCPVIRGPRTWSMPVALRRHAEATGARGRPLDGVAIFHCTHRACGVGMIDVSDVLRAEAALQQLEALDRAELLVGTVSHCHGALNRLVISRPQDEMAPVPLQTGSAQIP
jgi:hypothetical protein